MHTIKQEDIIKKLFTIPSSIYSLHLIYSNKITQIIVNTHYFELATKALSNNLSITLYPSLTT